MAYILSFLSFFAFGNGQPNRIPETRAYTGESQAGLPADKYGLWPTEEFTPGRARSRLGSRVRAHLFFGLELLFAAKGMFMGDGSRTDSLLVLHKGRLVYERYADGWDADTPHNMYSVTKSFTSALAGVAVGDGYIDGPGQRVIDFFPEAAGLPGWEESKRDMTVEQLLTMTSGIVCDTEESWNRLGPGTADCALAAFLLPQRYAPGTKYAYDGAAPQILMGVIARATGQDPLEYASEKLLRPLGLASADWECWDDGLPSAGFGLWLTPRDMLRFGYLYLNHGRWEDAQIVPADWAAITPPRSKAIKSYGLMFRNTPLLPFGSGFMASGAFGQYIEILPALDLVIARTGSQGPVDDFIHRIQNLFKLQSL